jgi:hypothetical protein
LGTTSEIEVVPSRRRRRDPARNPAGDGAFARTAINRFSGRGFHRARETCARWAAFFAAHPMPGCRDQGRKDGVSDPGARAGNGPARVRRGRSRHRCRCLVSIVWASVVGLEIISNQVHMCARNGAQISGQSGPARPRSSGPRTALVPRAMTQRMHRAIVRPVRVRDGRRCGRCWSRRPSRLRCSICARHRARLSASLRPRVRAACGP